MYVMENPILKWICKSLKKWFIICKNFYITKSNPIRAKPSKIVLPDTRKQRLENVDKNPVLFLPLFLLFCLFLIFLFHLRVLLSTSFRLRLHHYLRPCLKAFFHFSCEKRRRRETGFFHQRAPAFPHRGRTFRAEGANCTAQRIQNEERGKCFFRVYVALLKSTVDLPPIRFGLTSRSRGAAQVG